MRLPVIISHVLLVITPFVSAYAADPSVSCQATVSYMVEREGATNQEIFVGRLLSKGNDESTAKAALAGEGAKAKAKTMQVCRSEYENLSGCLQAKLGSSSVTLQTLSFSARKQLEDAFLSDCKKSQGLCKEVKIGEPQCVVQQSSSSEAAKEDGKGEKKKK